MSGCFLGSYSVVVVRWAGWWIRNTRQGLSKQKTYVVRFRSACSLHTVFWVLTCLTGSEV